MRNEQIMSTKSIGVRGGRPARTLAAAAIAAALAATLVGCGQRQQAVPSEGTPSAPQPSASATSKPAVPRQHKGSIKNSVKTRTMASAKPVSMSQKATFNSDISAEVGNFRHRYVAPKMPGELAGNSVIFDVTITNRSDRRLDLNAAVVNLADSSGAPGSEITTDPAVRFPNTLAAHGSATATYVFVVPKNKRSNVTVDVTISADLPVVVFHGKA